MTGDFAPLMRAVIAEPNDDAIRLIAADWLDEHGQPDRAAFIRCQVELASIQAEIAATRDSRAPRAWEFGGPLRGKVPTGHLDALRRREQELLGGEGMVRHGATYSNFRTWTPDPVWETALAGGWNYEDVVGFRRGFVAQITLSWGAWLTHDRAILETCPIRHARDGVVRITDAIYGIDRWIEGALAKRWPGIRFELPSG